ncbi:DEAD-domain-containing protein [Periconia macrospinosa]|uniref:RNA helicase n=1 Tax=Periconia macrospinosa TaxID=97972 RepID=A0A2V1D925_9PLEO|nr:DEAD-domain-containing protein [Periconia macrospinosa]
MSNAGDPKPVVDDAAAARKKQQEEDLQKAKEAGWGEPVPFHHAQGPAADAGDGEAHEAPAWLSDAAVYAWDDEFGEIGEPDPELEKTLFGDPNQPSIGHNIKALSFDVDVSGGTEGERVHPILKFDDAGLHPAMADNVRLCKYTTPTVIQAYCIPAVLTGHDVIGIAQTGSGKTAAFLIPILSKLMGKARQLAGPRPKNRDERVCAEPLVLVVCPTRELACQIFDEARRLCYRTMLRPCVIYGGAPTKNQREQLEKGCDVLIATPGRLMDFMSNIKLLNLSRLKFTVIDEADELLSEGWEDVMDKLFQGSSTNQDGDHTYLMFSATFPKFARKLVKDYMEEDHVRISVGRIGSTHQNITQTIEWVDQHMKNQALYDLIMQGGPQRTLIFVNAKSTCDIIDDFIYNKGFPVTSIHSDRTQREREDALRAFRTGKTPIMVATGVSARGLDVAFIKHVINYDLPSSQHGGIDEYIHRIGRTGRIGNQGNATSFYNERNDDIGEDLVKVLLENKQKVPDFLQDKMPANPEKIEWHDDTDDEDESFDVGGGVNSGFGGDVGGFGADGGFKADEGFGGGFKADDGFGGGFKADDGFGGGFTADDGFKADADADNKLDGW